MPCPTQFWDPMAWSAPPQRHHPLPHEQVLSSANQATPNTPAQTTPRPPGKIPAAASAAGGPDEYTGVEPAGERAYHEVFNPAVFPLQAHDRPR